MKTCNKCFISKEISEFSIRKGEIRHNQCKECKRKYLKKWYQNWKPEYRKKRYSLNKVAYNKLMAWYKELKKTLKCVHCGEDHPATLEFHHISRKSKIRTVSTMIRTMSKEKVLAEIEKCIVVCANCHRKRHRYD